MNDSSPISKGKLKRDSLYEQIVRILRKEIGQHNRICTRLATETKLAKRFDVSLITIRQAMAKLEKEGLIERRRGSGTYVVEKPLPMRHVGILLDVDISNQGLSPYYLKFVQEIRRKLTELNIESRAYFGFQTLGEEQSGLTCNDLMTDVKLDRIEGIIALFMGKERSWLSTVADLHIPVLDFTYLDEDGSWPMKSHFIHTAFSYLKQKGRKRIGILANESELDSRRPLRRIIQKLAPEYGVHIETHLMDMKAKAWEPGMGWERFRDIWRAQPSKPDALIVTDDNLFADCQKAIQELRISVPEEMSIIVRSSDAIQLNPIFPTLVWSYKVRELAFLYARRMKEILRGLEPQTVKSWPVSVQLEGPGYCSRIFAEDSLMSIVSFDHQSGWKSNEILSPFNNQITATQNTSAIN